jgi:L-ascorbate metabolism protein UlaG (beta-lactamase superfamily)
MRNALAAIALLAAPAVCAEEVAIRWLGQSCFLVTTPDGVRVLMDPVAPATGYENPPTS